jgi:Uma2 family endonuclease
MTTATKWNYEDLALLPYDGKRHEIIDGEHYVNPAPVTKHQRIVRNLGVALHMFVSSRKAGEVYFTPFDVVLSEANVVEPDILFVSKERLDIIGEKNIMAAPDIVVEVLSESNRRYDEIKKRKLYEEYGVAEYWIVDPELEIVKIYRGGKRVAELENENSDTLTTPLLPGLEIPLADIFA